ncbi:hypothetical protein HNQ96_003827 [Aminobacter lissarensis]|uniref:Uncharacterized protein n=1 Tax=Aminobacter carboxidus TaxID=376165 RepID=A0A8E1WI04_9HYPH|nr:hypothetical protein [Aminobacter lissarensis]
MKALPQPSKKHGETVCCAGVTPEGIWKRLYPVRFRHLSGRSSFKRWDQVHFSYSIPRQDKREESCHVHEDSIKILGDLPKAARARALNPIVLPSVAEAARRGQSLALIRPLEPRFLWKRKSDAAMAEERDAYGRAARQGSLLDKELETLEPSPYEFKFKFRDEEAEHTYTNGDWEAHAMFYRGVHSGKPEHEVLDWMDQTFNVEYPARGMAFAVGNQAKRPHIWQLLGVLRLDELSSAEKAQGSLF